MKIDWQTLFSLKTPCFIFDKDELVHNFTSFHHVLDMHFDQSVIGYSLKTNALPAIVDTARDCGCFAEVVSDDEYRQALENGFPEKKIIFNGPNKSYDFFKRAIERGSIVNIDSKRELEWLSEFAQEGINGAVGLRVNFDIEKIHPGFISAGEEGSRFGFSEEIGELEQAVKFIEGLKNIRLSGFHMHVGSKNKDPELFSLLAKKACDLYTKYHIKNGYIDIGGGFFGGGDDGTYYEKYIDRIYQEISDAEIKDATIIVEPGSSVVADTIYYLFEIIDTKKTAINHFAVSDGERLHIDPFLRKDRFQYHLLRKSTESIKNVDLENQVICGSTCMEDDRIFTLHQEEELSVGDRVLIDTVGSYTMCFNSNFINGLPIVYQVNRDGYSIIRDKWKPEQIFNKCYSTNTSSHKSILILNAGSRNKLVSDFKLEAGSDYLVITTDNYYLAPALYETESSFVTRPFNNDKYIDDVVKICEENNVGLVVSVLDPELKLLSQNVEEFSRRNILLNTAPPDVISRCSDKLETIRFLHDNGFDFIPTMCGNINFGFDDKELVYPYFKKPRNDSGSAGIGFIKNDKQFEYVKADSDILIQQYINGIELGVDVYVDLISHEVVSIFAKKKLKMRSGETDKSVSYKDNVLFDLIKHFSEEFGLCGANDIDVFLYDGKYYISEVNPRFGGGYIHAYECGVNFPRMLINNMNGIINKPSIGEYDEGIYMMKYFDVVTGRAD